MVGIARQMDGNIRVHNYCGQHTLKKVVVTHRPSIGVDGLLLLLLVYDNQFRDC